MKNQNGNDNISSSTNVGVNKRAIFSWSLYDFACSAFATIITTFIFSTYFITKIAENKITGTYQWTLATSIAGIIVALMSPIIGAIADYGGQRKKWLLFFTLLCVFSTGLLWFAYPSPHYVLFTLICFSLATIGMEVGNVFYNSFLPFLAPKNYFGRISGWAWGLGYVGGIIALVIALYGFIKPEPIWLDLRTAAQVRICAVLTALWLLVFSLPLFLFTPDPQDKKTLPIIEAIQHGLLQLLTTIKQLIKEKNLLMYFIARMIYIDGLNTLFAFGGIYAAGTFGMTLSDVILLGITLNISAGIGALLLAWVDDFIGAKPTILLSLLGLLLFGIPATLVKSPYAFWCFGLLLGLFVGPVQAASRSLLARLVSKQQSTEMFGFYAFSGRITGFIGPWALGVATYYFNTQRAGMATILVFFIIGGLLLYRVKEVE